MFSLDHIILHQLWITITNSTVIICLVHFLLNTHQMAQIIYQVMEKIGINQQTSKLPPKLYTVYRLPKKENAAIVGM